MVNSDKSEPRSFQNFKSHRYMSTIYGHKIIKTTHKIIKMVVKTIFEILRSSELEISHSVESCDKKIDKISTMPKIAVSKL